MANFLRSLSLRSNNNSSSSNSENKNFVGNNNKLRLRALNKEEFMTKNIQKNLQNWKIQKCQHKIYQRGSNFKLDCIVKIGEQTISISNQDFSHKLLSKKLDDKDKRQGHNYLHIGLIQVAAKPLQSQFQQETLDIVSLMTR